MSNCAVSLTKNLSWRPTSSGKTYPPEIYNTGLRSFPQLPTGLPIMPPFFSPSGPAQWLFQGHPATSKSLAAPLFPALRTAPTALSVASRQKQIPSNQDITPLLPGRPDPQRNARVNSSDKARHLRAEPPRCRRRIHVRKNWRIRGDGRRDLAWILPRSGCGRHFPHPCGIVRVMEANQTYRHERERQDHRKETFFCMFWRGGEVMAGKG